ncbi:MAG: SdpI family protein [Betaproteobacteria bacterium]|nr:SdpI family protein [Betaproteobacteria bacterium]
MGNGDRAQRPTREEAQIGRAHYLAGGVLVLAALAACAWVYPHLPARIPTRFGITGQPEQFGPREMVFAIGPGLMACTLVLFALIDRFAARALGVASFRKTYLELMLISVAMTGYFAACVVVGSLRPGFDTARALFAGAGLLFVLGGNLMGRVKRNWVFGIRLPWTLAGDAVWNATQRFAARAMVLAGLVAIGAALAGAPPWSVAAVLFIAPLASGAYGAWVALRRHRS